MVSKNTTTVSTKNKSRNQNDNEVLFQKLGSTWYAFASIDGEVVYSALPDGVDPMVTRLELFEVIEDHMKKISRASARKRRVDAAA